MSENTQQPGTPTRSGPRKVLPAKKVSILPLAKKYFKTVGLLVGVWCVGYFRFSATWLLIPPFFYILNDEYRKSKNAQKAFALEAAVDEKSAVLARIDELPSWVSDGIFRGGATSKILQGFSSALVLLKYPHASVGHGLKKMTCNVLLQKKGKISLKI